MKVAVILGNMGGPDSPDQVEQYLTNIFMDPDIFDIPLPEFLRKSFVRRFVTKRAVETRKIYNKIGGKTPLTRITEKQAALLENKLGKLSGTQFRVYPAMRYWDPCLGDVWKKISRENFDKIILFPLYPFYSETTTGSFIRLTNSLAEIQSLKKTILHIKRFGNHPDFIKAMAKQIENAVSRQFPNSEKPLILCSVHSIPVKRIKKGDPYQKELLSAFEQLKNMLPSGYDLRLSYQSKIGPIKWLEPSTENMLKKLSGEGKRELLVYPFGFIAENSETVYEIDILYREIAEKLGIETFYRIESLNTNEDFINFLYDTIMEKLKTETEILDG
jgi:ferrochelatase